jgi:hypothetical protein
MESNGKRDPNWTSTQNLCDTPKLSDAAAIRLAISAGGTSRQSEFVARRGGAIQKMVTEILGAGTTWVDRKGEEKPVTLDDILIIAPYNAQVFDLKDRIPGARIGTVDKFQGQEAPIVIYSMTTSTHADAPRGMNFLYSLNRLNVATSRAKCLSILVCSPALFEPVCDRKSQRTKSGRRVKVAPLSRRRQASAWMHERPDPSKNTRRRSRQDKMASGGGRLWIAA